MCTTVNRNVDDGNVIVWYTYVYDVVLHQLDVFVTWPVMLVTMKCKHVKIMAIRRGGCGLPDILHTSTTVNRAVDAGNGLVYLWV